MPPRAAAGLSLTSRTSGVMHASFLRRRKMLCGIPCVCFSHPTSTPPPCLLCRQDSCWLQPKPWQFGHRQGLSWLPSTAPHTPVLWPGPCWGCSRPARRGTPGHVPAGGSHWRGTLGEHDSSCGPRAGWCGPRVMGGGSGACGCWS